jgi:cell division protein FtsL
MEMYAVMILVVVLPMLMAATFLVLVRHWRRRQMLREELSPISRQHIDLYQGLQLNESAIESAKSRFRDLLERGEVEAVESSLRAGMQYVVQVRALAELGTDDAGRIL